MNTNTTTATATTTTTTEQPTTATDLATIERTALDRLNKSAGKSDLDDLLKGARRSLLLVDCSYSMTDSIATGGSKIDALRKVVASIRETQPVPVAAFGAQGADVQVVDRIPDPCGSTPLAKAIEFGQREGATHMVVVTDGYPDNKESAMNAARAFGRPIDVIYIGDGNDAGAEFCATLASLTGGSFNLTDLGKPKELAGKIVLMLGDGN